MQRDERLGSILIIVFIAFSYSVAYYYAIQYSGKIEFECEKISMLDTTFMLNTKFLTTGSTYTLISDIDIEIYFKPLNYEKILIGHNQMSDHLIVHTNQEERFLLFANKDLKELNNFLVENNIENETSAYIEFWDQAQLIVEISGISRSGSVTTTDTYQDSHLWSSVS